MHKPEPHLCVPGDPEDSATTAKIQNGKQDIPGRMLEYRRGSDSLVSLFQLWRTKAIWVDFHSPHFIFLDMYTFVQIQ